MLAHLSGTICLKHSATLILPPLSKPPSRRTCLITISKLFFTALPIPSSDTLCVCVCARVCVRACVHVCVCVVNVIVKRPVLPPSVVDGCSRNPLYYYYYFVVCIFSGQKTHSLAVHVVAALYVVCIFSGQKTHSLAVFVVAALYVVCIFTGQKTHSLAVYVVGALYGACALQKPIRQRPCTPCGRCPVCVHMHCVWTENWYGRGLALHVVAALSVACALCLAR